MLPVKTDAQQLVLLIVGHARQGVPDPYIIAEALPDYSIHHVAFVIEQLAQLPYPDLSQLIRDS